MGEGSKDWMDELKSWTSSNKNEGGLIADKSDARSSEHFSGYFKFAIEEKVNSRIHKMQGMIESRSYSQHIKEDEIRYVVRFCKEDQSTEVYDIHEAWLDKI